MKPIVIHILCVINCKSHDVWQILSFTKMSWFNPEMRSLNVNILGFYQDILGKSYNLPNLLYKDPKWGMDLPTYLHVVIPSWLLSLRGNRRRISDKFEYIDCVSHNMINFVKCLSVCDDINVWNVLSREKMQKI